MEATFKVDGWSKLGRVSETESVLKTMLVDGFSPDCLTFSYLIKGLGRLVELIMPLRFLST